ncbi:hypothetical protein JOY44_28140 (plasmid) [Phormidium sp. CLA17]|uniref:hypothetical protein n=1 Tax=Leptolyngbya sp. Cla-17 TaxID=2803751 RepID=UPI0014923729|nr:hypothetical protein [Leptolyngbya sp. Cla-17]MBM0745304.1 hypothetical protein [Leptolyngbya sp. Cla-17]
MLQISNLVVIPERDDFAHQLYYQDSDFQVVDRVVELVQQRGAASAQIALA